MSGVGPLCVRIREREIPASNDGALITRDQRDYAECAFRVDVHRHGDEEELRRNFRENEVDTTIETTYLKSTVQDATNAR